VNSMREHKNNFKKVAVWIFLVNNNCNASRFAREIIIVNWYYAEFFQVPHAYYFLGEGLGGEGFT
jgi:hypothetical protein